jgi:hypothetical protein
MLYISDDYGKTWTPYARGTWMGLDKLKTQLEKAGYATKYDGGVPQ